MRVLEVKSIDHGSTNYVANMLVKYLSEFCEVRCIESIKKMKLNPIRFFSGLRCLYSSDVLHCHLGGAAGFVGFFSKEKTKVATLHGFQKAKHYKRIDYFTAVSSAVKSHFVNQGVSERRIEVIPNGVEEKFLKIKRKDAGIFTICQVGNLDKNLELSFHSISLMKKNGYKIRFLVAGSGKKIEIFFPLLRDLNIYEEVKFLGYINNIEEVYGNSDLVIGTSHREGFHLPILEGMASGLPIVTTDSLGVRDFFIDGENGFFAEPDSQDFFFKMRKFYENKDLLKSIGYFNRQKACMYKWNLVAARYYEFFKNIQGHRSI